MNKIEYKQNVRRCNTELMLAGVEEEGLAQRHKQLSARQTYSLSPRECQDLAASLNDLERDMNDNQKTKDRIRREQLDLEAARDAGFDYERPNRSILNRLLPALPASTKEVTRDIVAASTSNRNWAAAIVLTVVSCGYVLWLMQTLPVALIMGAIAFFIEAPVADPTIWQITGKILAWVVITAGMGLLAWIRLPAKDYPNSERIAHYFLGAEHWSWTQRIWSCVLYGTSSPWILLAPLVVVPIRCTVALTLLWIYLHEEDSPRTAPEALAATGRFYSAYQRAMLVAGVLFSILAIVLLLVM